MIFQDEIFYESVYVSFWYIMQYMDIFIVKGDFNDRYENNYTWIYFNIQGTVINAIIEESYWSILANFYLSG